MAGKLSALESRQTRSSIAPAYVCLLLAAGVLVVYAQVRDFGFVDFDDPAYVYENQYTIGGLTWGGMRWALTSGYESNWLPLTRLSHMLDCELFGLHAGAHHVVNALLHLLNTLLLFAVLQAMTGATWRSAWVAAVFAVHPAHVESVAWVSERKDVLSSFFGLLGLWAYVRFAREPRPARYAAALLAFAASLLAKQMLVTLPVLFLILDAWPLRRLEESRDSRGKAAPNSMRRLVIEKLPFLGIAVAAGCVTVAVQWAGGSVMPVEARPLGGRLANAVVSYVRYLGHLFWPTDLTFFYPYRPLDAWAVIGAGALLLAVSFVAVRLRKRRPYVLVGWLWYLLTLLPVIGIVQVGEQALADRYTYFPSIGLWLIVAWGVPDLLSGWRAREVVLGVAGAIALVIYTAAGIRQVGNWRNSETLMAQALEITPDNHIAHNNLGYELLKQGRVQEARAHFALALQYAPQNARAHQNMGRALLMQGDVEAAVPQFEEAIRLNPQRAEAHQGLADALARAGRLSEAVPHYRDAIALGVATPDARNNLGVALASIGDVEGALREYLAALSMDSGYAGAHANAARALATLGRPAEALEHYGAALRLSPDDPDTHLHLAEVLAQLGRQNDGVLHVKRALELRPGWPEAESLLTTLSARPSLRSAPGS